MEGDVELGKYSIMTETAIVHHRRLDEDDGTDINNRRLEAFYLSER